MLSIVFFISLFSLGWFAAAPAAGGDAAALQGVEPTLIVDLAPDPEEGSARPARLFHDAESGRTYFIAATPGSGWELWSYGADGASQVADLCPGPCSSNPRFLASRDGKTFLTADDGVFGREIWSTDGTQEGTVRLSDACPGSCSGLTESEATIFQDRVIFSANSAELRDEAAWELWSSDGTAEGTARILDLSSGVCAAAPDLLPAGTDTLYWNCDAKLFASQGSDEEILEIFDGVETSDAAVLGDQIFVRRSTQEHGAELWTSDGTSEGGFLVTDFVPGPDAGIHEIYGVFDDYAYFSVEPSRALYRVDADLANASSFDGVTSLAVRNVRIAEDRIYFSHSFFNQGTNQLSCELRTTQGVSSQRLLNSCDGLHLGETAGGNLFFGILDGLWFSDGTAAGTRRIADLSSVAVQIDRSGDVDYAYAATSPESVLFSASEGQGLFRLWESDLTGARQAADLFGAPPGSGEPTKMTPVGDRLVFTKGGSQIFSTDGTPESLRQIRQGPRTPLEFIPYQSDGGERLLYSVSFPKNPIRSGIWSTDGQGTELLVEGVDTVRAAAQTADGSLILEARGGNYEDVGVEWWTTDLTDAGTEFLIDVSPGSGDAPRASSIAEHKALKDLQILAGASIAGEGSELWASDGSADGTTPLISCEGSVCPRPRDLTRVRKHFVVFSAFDEQKGRELWRTDGTPAGTRRIKDLLAGSENSNPHDFVRFRAAQVLFFARNAGGGESLWRTSGAPGGTREITDLSIDGRPSFVLESELVGDQFFFVAANALTGSELWVSDGTEDGTVLVRELQEGPESSFVQNLTAYGDSVLFTAQDAESGLELWMSDGTAQGTVRLTDLAPGEASSAPEEIVVVGDAVYFRGDDGETGRELWVIKP